MILIADSGSTKTDWTLLHSTNPLLKSEEIATFRTQGITPIHQTAGDIRDIIERELLPQLSSFPRAKLIASFLWQWLYTSSRAYDDSAAE